MSLISYIYIFIKSNQTPSLYSGERRLLANDNELEVENSYVEQEFSLNYSE